MGGSTRLNSNLSTIGQAAFYSSVQMQGGLSVFSTIGAFGLSVTSNTTIGGTVVVGGSTRLNSNLSTIGQAAFYSSVQMQGGLSVFSTIGAFGLSVASNVTIGGTLTVTGATRLNSNLSTVGQAAFYSSVQIQGGLSVFSSITAYGGLTVYGNIKTGGTDSIAIGNSAGISQGENSIAIGLNAGNSAQQAFTLAVGFNAGNVNQDVGSVALGTNAGNTSQQVNAIAIGSSAGYSLQGVNTVAIGANAGSSQQGTSAIAIGETAGTTSQGINAIAIGKQAGETNQASNSIILNASGLALDNASVQGLFIKPLRFLTGGANILSYNSTSSEIYYSDTLSLSSISTFGQVSFSTTTIRGTLGVTGITTLASTLNVTGNITASGEVTAYSDARAKDNIVTIDSPLDKIMKMRGVYYTRKDLPERGQRHVGVIAQEMEEIFPEVVLTDTSDEKKKSVAYGNITALLIECVKAQQSTINSLLHIVKPF